MYPLSHCLDGEASQSFLPLVAAATVAQVRLTRRPRMDVMAGLGGPE